MGKTRLLREALTRAAGRGYQVELVKATLAAASVPLAAVSGLSARTVDNRLGHVYAKLGIRGRAELAEMLGPSGE